MEKLCNHIVKTTGETSKLSNVLLDPNFEAQVANFGFAKLIPDGATHVTTRNVGILLLELAKGKKPIEKVNSTTVLVEWALPFGAYKQKFDELADPKLKGEYVVDELKRVIFVALICAHNQPERRPTMVDVAELLKGESKEKFSKMESDQLVKNPQPAAKNEAATAEEDRLELKRDLIEEENCT